jgi:hypothetical protein
MKELTQEEFNAMPYETRRECTVCKVRLKPVTVKPSQVVLCPDHHDISENEQARLTLGLLAKHRAKAYDMSTFPVDKVLKATGGGTDYYKKVNG